jgi:hypothetical protein
MFHAIIHILGWTALCITLPWGVLMAIKAWGDMAGYWDVSRR